MSDSIIKNNSQGITTLVISFLQQLREAGFGIGMGETEECLKVAESGLMENRLRFKWGLKAICCHSQEDLEWFEQIFEEFWSDQSSSPYRLSKKMKLSPASIKQDKASLVLMGKGNSGLEEKESRQVSGANERERLVQTDFTKLSEIDSAWLDELAAKLLKEMSRRIRRRFHTRLKGDQVHFRKTIRKSVEKGGVPVRLSFRGRKRQKDKLVLFLDVSGSMDKYSFFILRFVFSLKDYFKDLEVFIFSTRLVRITRLLKARGMHHTLGQLSQENYDWSGGTRIGYCLQDFNRHYGKLISRNHSVVIMVSDGLDTGDPQLLESELSRIRLKTKKLIWMNPLKGMKGYAPTARGMKTALPFLDIFGSAHNLESILKLEEFLMNA